MMGVPAKFTPARREEVVRAIEATTSLRGAAALLGIKLNSLYVAMSLMKIRAPRVEKLVSVTTQHAALFTRQRGRCATCPGVHTERVPLQLYVSIVDGERQDFLLCTLCALGMMAFRDDPARLRRALEIREGSTHARMVREARVHLDETVVTDGHEGDQG